MLVTVTVRVDIDPESWRNEFHVDRSDVREDVKTYLKGLCESQIQMLGVQTKEVVTSGE